MAGFEPALTAPEGLLCMPLTSGNMLASALSGRVSGAVRQGDDMTRQRRPPQLTVGHAAKARPQASAGAALPMATGSGIGSRCGQHGTPTRSGS